MMIKKSRAYCYAQWCVLNDNDRVGIYVKKQAQIWLDIADGKSSEAYICEKKWKKITRLLK